MFISIRIPLQLITSNRDSPNKCEGKWEELQDHVLALHVSGKSSTMILPILTVESGHCAFYDALESGVKLTSHPELRQ